MVTPRRLNRPIHLYLSYAWNDNNALEEFGILLQRHEAFKHTVSIISPFHPANRTGDERSLYEVIKTKMKFCDAVIMFCREYPDYMRWINKELIASSEELHKPVIVVRRDESEHIPFIVKQHADMIVDWDAESIISAIKKLTIQR